MDEHERIERTEDAVEAEAHAVEAAALLVIAERVGSISDGDDVADALSHSAEDMASIDRIAAKGAEDVSAAAVAAMADMDAMNGEWAKPFYEARGTSKTGKPKAIADRAAEAASEAVRALCRTSVMGLCGRDGTGFVPLRQAYVDIVGTCASAMMRGESDYRRAVADAVRRLGGGGIRVRYESGAARELYGAVRMSVMDTYRTAMDDARRAMGEEFGADGYEVSAHSPCAPDHVRFQGRQFTLSGFEAVQESLERPIAEGYNCRHMVWPIILGVSRSAYTRKDLDKMADESAETVTFTGLDGSPLSMTRYEATQYQRRLEREMRSAKLDARLAEAAGADPTPARRRSRAVAETYRSMSEDAGIVAKPERARLYLPR